MSTIESQQLEEKSPTLSMLNSIQNELAQYDIRLSFEQEARLKTLSEADLALIHQELINLGKNIGDIDNWIKVELEVHLNKPLDQNG